MHELTLEDRITAWREEIQRADSINLSARNELESHLRDAIEAELEQGATPAEAFEKATATLGTPTQLDPEYQKVHGSTSWAKRLLWMAAGYGTLQLAFLIIHFGGRIAESFTLRWFPGITFKLPFSLTVDSSKPYFSTLANQTLEHAHIAVLTKGAFSIAAYIFLILLATRCIRGRSRIFNRFFSDTTSWKIICIFTIIPLTLVSSVYLLLNHTIPQNIASQQDIDLYGMSEAAFRATSNHFITPISQCLGLLWISFIIWGLTLTRRQTGNHFINWMLGGYLVATALYYTSSITSALASIPIHNLIPDLFSPTLHLTQFLLAAILLTLAWHITHTTRPTRLEPIAKFLSKHAIPIVILINVLPQTMRIFGIAEQGLAIEILNLAHAGNSSYELYFSTLFIPYFIQPWLILAISIIAGHSLLRQQGKRSNLLERFAGRLGLPLD